MSNQADLEKRIAALETDLERLRTLGARNDQAALRLDRVRAANTWEFAVIDGDGNALTERGSPSSDTAVNITARGAIDRIAVYCNGVQIPAAVDTTAKGRYMAPGNTFTLTTDLVDNLVKIAVAFHDADIKGLS